MAEYDVVVIGAGSGGYVAAIRAAQLGAKVAVIEKEKLGGTCLNWGCIPTKTLVTTADLMYKLRKAEELGVKVDNYKLDFGKVMERKEKVVNQLVDGIGFLFEKNNIELISGEARILKPGVVSVLENNKERKITTEKIIIATGSSPVLIPAFNYDGEKIITSKEMLELDRLPSSLLIVGAGVVGCEMAGIMSSFGVKVTLVELMPQILPGLAKSTARRLERYLKKQGIDIYTGIKLESIQKAGNGVSGLFEDGEEVTADKALLAVGRKPNTAGLGLEELGIELNDKGGIIVNKKMETNVTGIYAVGDVTNKIMLAHVASTQGKVAAENIMGHSVEMNYNAVPSVIFTHPEVATVGLDYQQARKEGYKAAQGRFTYRASGKALAMNEQEGMVNLTVDKDSKVVLGGEIMGVHASDLIAEIALAVENKLTAEDIARTIHAHPTLAENIMEAAENALGQAIHG